MKEGSTQLVVGGGFVGLCSAYFLAKAGCEVTVIDRDPSFRESCSNRNAGMIVPSHFIPLAAPGVVAQGLKWMFNPSSPFSFRPQLDPELWSWCWKFWRSSNQQHVDNSKEFLRDMAFESRALFEVLSEELGFTLEKRGLLMLCRSEAGMKEEAEVAKMAGMVGVDAEICGPERLRELDPEIRMDALGGVWFPQDCHLDSEEFLAALRRGIEGLGGKFRDEEVIDFRAGEGEVTHAMTSKGEEISADGFIISCGAWSKVLARKMGVSLPLQGGKGYSFTLPAPVQMPRLCSLLKEGRVAVTPMGDSLRVAGTMEIGGNDLSINPRRLRSIIDSFLRFFPEFKADDFEGLEPWSGLRPCSPDGLPYIGKLGEFPNVILATGHSMLGLSLGPVTGKLVSGLMMSGAELDSRLEPDRF
ncbi:NAD(P)/FAD-dependent oxidoreductase [Haloferula sp.]|uniref:NAD(P)/FAD-dependent oxidoreductase n=1 Tax=Haloferula sp. TaxID=2497595 RepID=UPI0032A01703